MSKSLLELNAEIQYELTNINPDLFWTGFKEGQGTIDFGYHVSPSRESLRKGLYKNVLVPFDKPSSMACREWAEKIAAEAAMLGKPGVRAFVHRSLSSTAWTLQRLAWKLIQA